MGLDFGPGRGMIGGVKHRTLLWAGLLVAGLAQAQPADSLAVLFIGNSHTYVNDLPGLFRGLAEAGGRLAKTDMSAPGGYSLAEHCSNPTTISKILQGGWDYVVLQEQSQIPTIEYWRYNGMYPSARSLDSMIRGVGCRTALYMTWGWKNGGTMNYGGHSSPEFRDYFHMQDSVTAAYLVLGDELGARMSPVGMAWARAKRLDSLVDLWQTDECHATLKGTYLAACMFYAALFEANPVGLGFLAGLSPEDALFCQEVAWATLNVVEEARPEPGPGPVIRIQPNPAREMVRVGCSSATRLELYDASGRVVQSQAYGVKRGASSALLDLRGLTAGVYILTSGSESCKLVVER